MALVNPNMGTSETTQRNFTRMNPSEFPRSNVEEDPKEFINVAYKVLVIMGVTPVEK